MVLFVAALACLFSYLLGSIPFGLLLTRWAGLGDIRTIGSGNIGATNVLRTGKKWLALATLLLDFGKGFVASFLPLLVYVHLSEILGTVSNDDARALASQAGYYVLIAAPVLVLVGHIFPIWLKFKGGKGVATLFGLAFAFNVYVGVVCAILWLSVFAITRISSLSALVMIAGYCISMIYWMPPFLYTSIIITLLIIYTHRDNIRRLLKGEELTFKSAGDKKDAA